MERRPPLELRFSLGSIPVAVSPSFWLFTALLGLAGSDRPAEIAGWVGIVFVSVLVHELGHAVVMRMLGAQASIRMYSMGGLTAPDRALGRGAEILSSLAGPGAGFILGGLVLVSQGLVAPAPGTLGEALVAQAKWVNIGWSLINLLPVLPLDGGHILAGILGPKRRGAAMLAGALVAGAIAGLAAWAGMYFMAVLFALFSFQNLQARSRPAVPEGGMTVDDALGRGWAELAAGDEEDAERIGRLVASQAGDPDGRNRGRDLAAWASLARGNRSGALKLLEDCEPPSGPRALTWAMVLEALDEKARALPWALQAVETEPSETSALQAIRLELALGQLQPAEELARRFAWQRPGAREAAEAEIAHARGDLAAAAASWRAAFEASRRAVDALGAARELARSGEPGQAVEWVRRAVEAGLDEPSRLSEDPDLASLRGLPAFAALTVRRPAR